MNVGQQTLPEFSGGDQDCWAALTLVMDCHPRELLGWRLSKNGNAKSAVAALEDALLNRYGTLGQATTYSACTMAWCLP